VRRVARPILISAGPPPDPYVPFEGSRYQNRLAPAHDIVSRAMELIPSAASLDQAVLDALSRDGGHTRIGDHDTLKRFLKAWPRGLNEITDYIPIESVLQEALRNGYVCPESQATIPRIDLTKSGFDASRHIAFHTRPHIMHLVCNFLLPDPLQSTRVAWVFDQLWIAYRSDQGTRKIALIIDFESILSEESLKRDQGFAAMGYETYHAAGWWLLIDPQRVIYEFMQAAEIVATQQRRRQYPGPTINDYLCASPSCRRPMVRDAFGYGIVFHKGLAVHEECYNRVIDEDEMAWVEQRGDGFS
jgi:hypothetical protein